MNHIRAKGLGPAPQQSGSSRRRRHAERAPFGGAAIGYVDSRIVEAALILVGVVAILSVLTLHQHFAGAHRRAGASAGRRRESLVAMRQWTFLLARGSWPG